MPHTKLASDELLSEDKLYTASKDSLTALAQGLLADAKAFFVGHTGPVGVLLVGTNMKFPMFIKSGDEGGPWGGTQRGGIPRMEGWAFTKGGQSEKNIATHVEGHASAIMWQRDLKIGHLLVDRPMCDICSNNLFSCLPPGSVMFVYSQGEGRTVVRASEGKAAYRRGA